MSDEPVRDSNHEPERVAAEEDKRGDEPTLRVRRKDGSWETVERKPLSDDPEVEAMGKLRWEDLQAIVEDPSHPQHEQAVTYSRLLGERMRKSIAPLMGDVTKQYESLLRDITRSFKWPTFKLPKSAAIAMPGVPDHNFVPPEVLGPSAPEHEPADGDDVEAPLESRDPVLDLVERVTETNSLLADQNKLLRYEASGTTVQTGVQTVRASQEAVRARRSLAAAWAAVGVTVAVGIVQIWQNAGG